LFKNFRAGEDREDGGSEEKIDRSLGNSLNREKQS
jgi:hypothetical protein